MKLKSIKMKAFRSHLDTEIPVLRRFNMFLGANGSGKSSIIDAICYALVGICRGTDESGRSAEILNSALADGKTTGSIVLDTDRGEIGRYVGNGPRSPAQQRISKEIGVDPNLLRIMVQPTQFMRLRPADQKDLLLAIIGGQLKPEEARAIIGEWIGSRYGADVYTRLTTAEGIDEWEKKFREERPQVKGEINGTHYSAPDDMPKIDDATPEMLQEYRGYLKEYENELLGLRSSEQSAIRILEDRRNRLKDLEAKGGQITQRLDELKSKQSLQDLANDLSGKIGAIEQRNVERKKQIQELSDQVSKADANLLVLKEQGQRVSGLKGSCPTCQQPIVDSFKKTILDDLRIRYDSLNKETIKRRKTLSELMQIQTDENVGKLRDDLNGVNQSIVEFDQLWERLEDVRIEIDQTKNALKEGVHVPDPEKIKDLESRIAIGTKKVEDVDKVLFAESHRLMILRKRKELEQSLERLEALIEILGPKGELRKRLIGGGLAQFVEEINGISAGLGLDVKIEMDPWVIRANGYPSVMLSESEQYRLSLAFAAVFAKRSKIGILCLDGADVLDAENRSLLTMVLLSSGLDQAIIAATGEVPSEIETSTGYESWLYYSVAKGSNGSSVVAAMNLAPEAVAP